MSASTTSAAGLVSPDLPPPLDGGGRRLRVRKEAASLSLLFAAVLLFFPSEVVVAGPLMSNGAPARLIGTVALLLLAADLLNFRKARTTAVSSPVVLLLVYLVGALFLYGWSAFRGDDDSAESMRTLLFAVSSCGIGVYTAVRVRTLATAHRIIGWVVAGCVLSALVGIVQALGAPLIWADVVTLPGMSTAGNSQGLGFRNGMVRIFGTAGHPIEFAVILGCCLPLAIHLGRHSATALARRASYTAAAVMALALPFALSRGGLICIALSMLIFLSMQGWRTRVVTGVAGLVAVAAAYVAVPSTYQAVEALFSNAADDPSVTGRLDDYPLVDAAFNASPWLGGAPLPDLYLDNQWLVTLTQDGLVGVVFLAALFVVPTLSLVKAARTFRTSDPLRASLAAALAGGVVAIGFSGTVFDLLFFAQVSLLLFLIIGLSAVVCRAPSGTGQGGRKTANPREG